ncbi:MAG: carbon-nitrogen family hydrolase [Oscillospiraceae bacterium]|nr:carbon-nitrogen family hydrolase [Oscillospiraceae bacterium]
MKICAAQTDIIWENKQENMRRSREIIETAAGQGAHLVVFPELSLTGFTMNPELAEPPDGRTVQFFTEVSREFGIAAAFGFACRHDGVITNRLCIADRGEITAKYDKIHPFSYGGECEVYTGGSKLAIAEVFGESVGLSVCYDLRFPEVFQALSEECSVILTIANWPDKRSEHWTALLKARAIENQCYIVGCNRCGNGGGLSYSGDSAVYSPSGELICAAAPYKEELIYADISREECSIVQNSFPLKKDRRYDLYRKFYER